LVLMALLAAGAVVGLVLAPFGRRRRPLRLAAFGLAYGAMELAVLVATGALWLRRIGLRLVGRHSEQRWMAAHYAVLGWALALVLAAGRRCLGFRVTVTGPTSPDPLGGPGPVLVLARHGGPGDSFALVHLLLTRYHRGVRVVLKEFLQLDPALDVVLNRLGCCFLPAPGGSGEDLTEGVADLVRALEPGDALLLFPEGGNWTPTRRRRAIRHLRQAHRPKAARAAALMDNVLPPRPGGVLACLDARPDLDVAIVAHSGLDQVVRARQGWDRLPFATPMTVRVWPPAAVPPSPEERAAWLMSEWAIVDEWIDAFRADAVS
jgi:1-acyl-sn-glycerol-3-phosphate acyltransferase